MRRCPRCASSMVQEPFADHTGRGQRLICLLCGESTEAYEKFGGMTPDQLADLMQPARGGRPRRIV